MSADASTPVEAFRAIRDAHGSALPRVRVEWDDLTVTGSASAGRCGSRDVPVLSGVTATAHPGRLTLVMGNPGSGKTSVLRTAAGLPVPGAKSSPGGARFVIEGASDKLASDAAGWKRLASLSTQFDNHYGLLTVENTLEFAEASLQPRVGTARTGLTGHQVGQFLGLGNALSTRLGTETARGVSGGEARRVSVGEALVGPARVWLLDSFSDGLDAARTKSITSGLLRPFARELGGTVVASLQQPAQELFELFDDLILLRDGHCLYSGPATAAVPFFRDVLGLVPPDDISDPEFLASVSSEPATYDGPGRRTASAPAAATPLESAAMAAAFREHGAPGKAAPPPVADPAGSSSNGSTGHLDEAAARRLFAAPYARPVFSQLASLLWREVVNTVRDGNFLKAHFVRAIILALVVGSLFGTLTSDDFVQRISLIFFCCLQLAMGGAAELPVALNSKLIVDRQSRVLSMYRPALYAMAVSIVFVPIVALETILFTAPVYYMTGFADDASRFAIFFAGILLLVLCMTTVFRVIAWSSGSLEVALAGMVPFIALFILFSGFLATRSNLGWGDLGQGIYWFTPVSWTIRLLAINEFTATEYDAKVMLPGAAAPQRKGDAYLATYDVETDPAWIGYGFAYVGGLAVFLTIVGAVVFSCRTSHEPRGSKRRDPGAKPALGTSATGGAGAPSRASATPSPDAEAADGAATASADADGKDAPAPVVAASAPATSARSGKLLAFGDLVFDVRLVGAAARNQQAKDAKAASAESKAEPPALAAELDHLAAGPVPKGHKRLLNRISGVARPGRVLALCGESGAGKTTLLNTLAGRTVTQGSVRGTIQLGGTAIAATQLRPRVGYVEQFDRHLATATVREALEFSAWMRRGSNATSSVVAAAVDEALDLLELRAVEHRPIGDDKEGWGLSRGERKRVTIGVELVADPSVLFLDEPTTALSSTQARDVSRVIRRVADSGRTVICTLHQPSAGVWANMDDLLLLARGGYTVYFGPLGRGSRNMVDYLSALPGSHPLPDGMNPADYMLDVIGSEGKGEGEAAAPAAGAKAADAAAATAAAAAPGTTGGAAALASRSAASQVKPAPAAGKAPTKAGGGAAMSAHTRSLLVAFRGSEARANLNSRLAEAGIKAGSHDTTLAQRSAASMAHGEAPRPSGVAQFWLLLKRASLDFLRDGDFSYKRCVLFVILALVAGGVFFQIKDDDQGGVMSLVGGIVMGVIFVGAIMANTTAVAIGKRRPSFTREQASHTYSPTAYGLALNTAALPWTFVFAALFTVVYALMVGYDVSIIPTMLLVVFLFASVFSTIAIVLGFVAETPQLVTALLSVVMALSAMFSGFFIPRADIAPGWIWLHYLSPQTYALEAAIPAAFVCPEGEAYVANAAGPCSTINAFDSGEFLRNIKKIDFIERLYGLNASDQGRAIGIEVGYYVVFQILLILVLWRLRAKAA